MVTVFPVRKYSYLKENNEWEHFPSRNDIHLVVNRGHFKILWKSTVLDEFSLEPTSDYSIYTKFPSIGFKYLSDTISKRFQLGISTKELFDNIIGFLSIEGYLNSSSMASPQGVRFPFQQNLPLTSMAANVYNPYPQFELHAPKPISRPLLNFMQPTTVTQSTKAMVHAPSNLAYQDPNLVFTQSQYKHNSSLNSQLVNEEVFDCGFLSQVVNAKDVNIIQGDDSKPKDVTNFDEMTDTELSLLLEKKIKDIDFINFVSLKSGRGDHKYDLL